VAYDIGCAQTKACCGLTLRAELLSLPSRCFLWKHLERRTASDPEAPMPVYLGCGWCQVRHSTTKGAEMSERVAAASPRLRARMTGVVYLLYFLTALSAEVFVGRSRLVA
jgi:hypothetical protein